MKHSKRSAKANLTLGGVLNTKPKSKATCHPDRPLMGKGLCKQCYQRQWQTTDPQRYRDYARKADQKLRQQVIAHLGGKCKRCGFCDWRALQIDHVEGGGNKELKAITSRRAYYRKVLADVSGLYQLLCANCNWIKRYEAGEFDVKGTNPTEAGLAEAGSQVESAG